MTMKFCEVVVGGRFEFRGRRYEKMDAEVGRDEDRGGNVFHGNTEVVMEVKSAECRVQNAGRLRPVAETRKVECRVQAVSNASRGPAVAQALPGRPACSGAATGGGAFGESALSGRVASAKRAVLGPVPGTHWVRAGWRARAGRLGRSADRDLRAYGTV